MTSLPDRVLEGWGEVGRRLLRTLAGGRISPSYLFEGADGGALLDAARAFALGLLAGGEPEAADERLRRRVENDSHPDLHLLTKDKATVISVAALSAALERAHSTPMEAARQVFLVHPAEAMEAEGIARYLKALEEPPPGTVFVLLSTRPERLPATVLSRCRRVRFPPLDAAEVRARLEARGVAAAPARWAARHAGGSPTRALRYVEAGLEEVVAQLVACAVSPEPSVARTAERALAHLTKKAGEMAAADPGATDTKRQHLRVLLGDVLRALCGEARERVARRPGMLAETMGEHAALDLLEGWGRLAGAVAANVTPAAVLLEAVSLLRGVAPSGAKAPG